MAIFHLSVNLISRKAGRSSTAAAAYRAAERIEDERTGEVHDYSRRSGVESTELVLPSGVEWQPARAEFWNAVEAKNKRADAQVAREFVVALPAELDPGARRDLAVQFARVIVDRYQVGADVAIHAPGRGDDRNHHAHILTTTNRVEASGKLGNKVRELDGIAASRGEGPNAVEQLRSTWADLTNQALEKAGSPARVDHRTLADQGIDRAPTVHLGPAAFGYERRTGEVSRKREDWGIEAEAFERLRQAKAAGEQERHQIRETILDLSHDLKCALAVQALQERMSVQDVDEDIRRLDQRLSQRVELPRVADLVEKDPLVVQLGREQKELEETKQDLYRKLQEAEKNEQRAIQWTTRYRTDSPFLTKMHDLGVLRSASLEDFERVRIESAQARTELKPRIEDVRVREAKAKQQQIEARSEAERRIAREQAPLLQQIAEERKQIAEEKAELLELRDRKTGRVRVLEQPEPTRDYARDSAEKKFKKWTSLRSLRSSGWGDRGEDWQAMPAPLREAIAVYNAAPDEVRPALLKELMSKHLDQVVQFQQQQKEQDRGR